MSKDYRSFLRLGRTKARPIRGKIRTERRPGDVESVYDHRSGEHVLVRYGERDA